jgi:hypothetical protein
VADPPFDRPDPLWLISTGSGPGGLLVQQDLADIAADWPRVSAAPDEVAWALSITRSLWIQSWWRRELLVVSLSWSLIATERALRVRFEDPPGAGEWRIGRVLDAALQARAIEENENAILKNVFKHLRNP